ncbi:MAG: GNAT family N-acetyltransferase [Acidiferrobacteraceae bacterium]|jgi:predicted GNAT family N-acyltransferase
MSEPVFTVSIETWPETEHDIRFVRDSVFVREMQIPAELEWDGLDSDCVHVVARDADGQPIGTGRLLPNGKIGRMAVLPPWRSKGIGKSMLESILEAADKAGIDEVWLHAQLSVVGFYREARFAEVGNSFVSAGIPHQKMVRDLKT